MSDRLVAETDTYATNTAVERPCPQWDPKPATPAIDRQQTYITSPRIDVNVQYSPINNDCKKSQELPSISKASRLFNCTSSSWHFVLEVLENLRSSETLNGERWQSATDVSGQPIHHIHSLTLEDGTEILSQSISKYQSTLFNIPEERRKPYTSKCNTSLPKEPF